jgi:quinol monooxygenase YgiN
MSRLAVIVTITVAPDRREQIVSLLMAHRARCLSSEPGTLHFDILIPEDDATKVLEYGVYHDATAFEAHRTGPSLARWREETSQMGVSLHALRCVPVEAMDPTRDNARGPR